MSLVAHESPICPPADRPKPGSLGLSCYGLLKNVVTSVISLCNLLICLQLSFIRLESRSGMHGHR